MTLILSDKYVSVYYVCVYMFFMRHIVRLMCSYPHVVDGRGKENTFMIKYDWM